MWYKYNSLPSQSKVQLGINCDTDCHIQVEYTHTSCLYAASNEYPNSQDSHMQIAHTDW